MCVCTVCVCVCVYMCACISADILCSGIFAEVEVFCYHAVIAVGNGALFKITHETIHHSRFLV